MKQHITPKQFQEMDELDAVRLFDLVIRDDWYQYHHKKITIGKMIEILNLNNKKMLSEIMLSYHDHLINNVNYPLCDELWEAVKILKFN